MKSAANNDQLNSHRMSHSSSDRRAIIFLFAATAFFFRKALFAFSPVILGSRTLVDLTHQFYPWRFFGFGLLRQGIIPLWNPYLFCGYPFIENWQSAIFYPLNLIFLCMPTHTAISVSFALHVFLIGAFTYFFMRRLSISGFGALIASLTFMFSAPVILRIFSGHLSVVCALPWFPAQLLAVEAGLKTRRGSCFILAGVALGMQLLSGHPQYVYYSLIGIALYVIFRGVFIRGEGGERGARIFTPLFFAGYIILGFALAAVQVLPSLDFVRYSSRGQMLEFGEAAGGSFPPENLVTFLMPTVFGDFVRVFCWGRCYFWEAAVYVGILSLTLALTGFASRERRRIAFIFLAIGAISLIMAMGGYTPLLEYIYKYVPGFKLIRGNAKLLFLTIFSVSVLAGVGAQGIVEDLRGRRRLLLAILCVVIMTMLIAYAAYAAGGALLWEKLVHYRKAIDKGYWKILDNPLFLQDAYHMFMDCIRRLAIFLGLTALIILCALVRRISVSLLKIMIATVVVADLWSFDISFLLISPISSCEWPGDAVAFFKSDPGIYRFLRDIRVPVPGVNQGMNYGFQSFEGYDTNAIDLFKIFTEYFHLRSEETAALLSRPETHRIVSLANIKYLIVPAATNVADPLYLLRFDNGYIRIYENKTVIPRALIAHRARLAKNAQEALRVMDSADFDPSSEVVLEEEPGIPLAASRRASLARIERYAPNEVIVHCNIEEPGVLVLSDTYYPGWKVLVDGAPGRILRANYMFRGVPLGKGTHEVRFTYAPASFRWGAAVSGVTVMVIIAFYLAALARRETYAKTFV
ncbi:MAG: YfhO family protein [Candidatus Aureabacteria bacterium]|nr:YfhO family protein [Candidatus Auribacterota bacterium]